jgi:hypothetical protein
MPVSKKQYVLPTEEVVVFQRVAFGQTNKEPVSEEQVREELSGFYDDIDAVIKDMQTNPRTIIANTDKAVYWYGM